MQVTDYSTQAEAQREARIAIWGDVHVSKRECIRMERDVYSHVVTARVNGKTVVFFFDNYGRPSAKTLVLGWEDGKTRR